MPLYGQWQTAKALGIEGRKGIIPCYNWYAFQTACGPEKRNLALACGTVPPLDVLTTTRNSDGATVDSAFGLAAFVLQFIALRNLSDHFGKSHWYVLGIILLPFIFWWRLSTDASIKE